MDLTGSTEYQILSKGNNRVSLEEWMSDWGIVRSMQSCQNGYGYPGNDQE